MVSISWCRVLANLPQVFAAASSPSFTHRESQITTRYESLVVSYGNLTVGCDKSRPSVLINGTSPGPVLHFKSNERVIIRVTNMLPHDNFTMHWHGLSMAASPTSDGTPHISQWPIAPGDWYEYEFFLDEENVGTYYYHSHIGMQLTTAHGALIVHSSKPRPKHVGKVPKEKVMLISDYWHKSDEVLVNGLLADPFVWTNSSSEIYLNGRSNGTCGRRSCADMFPVVDVEPDTTYRLKWIHAGSLMYLAVGIQDHEQDLVEADGTNLLPKTLSHFEFAPGQRYNTLLRTKSVAEIQKDGRNGTYVIQMASRWRRPGPTNFAVLRYRTDENKSKHTKYVNMSGNQAFYEALHSYVLPNETFGWIANELRAEVESLVPVNVNNTLLKIDIQQVKWGGKGIRWVMNNVSYRETSPKSTTPYLVQLYKKLHPSIDSITAAERSTSQDVYDAVSDTYVLEAGQVVDILLTNRRSPSNKSEIHPMHMHSRKFWVLAAGPGSYSVAAHERYKFAHPYRRDTVVIYPGPAGPLSPPGEMLGEGEGGGWALIRYQASATNAGVFPLHCHIAPHLVMGQAVVFTVAPSMLPELLGSFEPFLEYRGSAFGNASWVPERPNYFVNHP